MSVNIAARDATQIFCGYVLVTPLSWTDEAMRYAMVWVAFPAGRALVFRQENMVRNFIVLGLSDSEGCYAPVRLDSAPGDRLPMTHNAGHPKRSAGVSKNTSQPDNMRTWC